MSNKVSADQIKSALLAGAFSNQELDGIVMALKFARAQLGKQVRRSLKVGEQVKFSGRNGVSVGVLTKVAIKYATVKVGTALWRVPMNMLEAA